MSRVLIDTNVFIYYLDSGSVFNENAKKILESDNKLFICSKNISEFLSVTTKLKLENDLILEFLRNIFQFTTVLYTSEKSTEHLISLFNIYKPKGNQVYDLEVVSVMLANKIEFVATFNKKDFEKIKEIKIFQSN